MEFYDKFMDRFQDIKSKESCCQQGKCLAITYSLQKQIFGGGNMTLPIDHGLLENFS